jgi:DNA-binding SARP family transcriptional activator
MIHASLDGDLRVALANLHVLRGSQKARGHHHHEGTTLLNIAVLEKMRGNGSLALAAADAAIDLLNHDPYASEHASAQAVRGWAIANLGDLEGSRAVLNAIVETSESLDDLTRAEVLLEASEVETLYGDADRASDLLSEVAQTIQRYSAIRPMYLAAAALLALRRRDLKDAQSLVRQFQIGEFSTVTAGKSQQLLLRAYCDYETRRRQHGADSSDALDSIHDAMAHASIQGAGLWLELGRLLKAAQESDESFRREVRRLGRVAPSTLSALSEVVIDRISAVQAPEAALIQQEMQTRPERWLVPLRTVVDGGSEAAAAVAGPFLDVIGGHEDVARLRRYSRRARASVSPDLGRGLARRIASRVHVEDQGRVAIIIGNRSVEGTSIRRKVLTLLCFLLTRPRFSATRDEVLDVLWPDFDPGVALNSLNQTVYFLRRVLEPGYREDTSPGYLRHESDVVWLDRQLVDSRSQQCMDFLKGLPADPSPTDVERLFTMYRGPFALDFAYEEWAVAYRDQLHASYLQVIETAVASDIASGHFARGIRLARQALAVDPEAEQIELSLLRLLRLSGAHAAAAEQYVHYSTQLRELLGIEPPPLEAL